MSTKEIFEKDGVEIEVVKPEKKKRKLTEKQLENLRIGREKMAAKRAALKKEKEAKQIQKEDKKAVKQNKVIKKENKREKKKNTESQKKAEEHKKALLEKRKQRELQKEQEALKAKQATKLSRFDDLRSKWLLKTNDIEEYEKVENELDSIPEEVIVDDNALENTLLDIMKKYKGEDYDKVQE